MCFFSNFIRIYFKYQNVGSLISTTLNAICKRMLDTTFCQLHQLERIYMVILSLQKTDRQTNRRIDTGTDDICNVVEKQAMKGELLLIF